MCHQCVLRYRQPASRLDPMQTYDAALITEIQTAKTGPAKSVRETVGKIVGKLLKFLIL